MGNGLGLNAGFIFISSETWTKHALRSVSLFLITFLLCSLFSSARRLIVLEGFSMLAFDQKQHGLTFVYLPSTYEQHDF